MGIDILMALSLLASLAGQGISSYKKNKYQKDVEKTREKQEDQADAEGLKNAMSRVLDVEATPYVAPIRTPKAPDTTWSDVLSGIGQAGAQGAAMYQAPRRYPMGTSTGYEDINKAYEDAMRRYSR